MEALAWTSAVLDMLHDEPAIKASTKRGILEDLSLIMEYTLKTT